jgi:hypothetical protein
MQHGNQSGKNTIIKPSAPYGTGVSLQNAQKWKAWNIRSGLQLNSRALLICID